MADSTVHAELAEQKIVRYDKAGKWFLEYDPPNLHPCKKLDVDGAAWAAMLMLEQGGTVRYGLPGGRTFDRLVHKHVEQYGRGWKS